MIFRRKKSLKPKPKVLKYKPKLVKPVKVSARKLLSRKSYATAPKLRKKSSKGKKEE